MSSHYELSACPACGAERADTLATADQLRAEMEALWVFHLARLRRDVPPERLADRAYFSHAPPLGVVRCRNCGLVFRNPRERERDLREIYADETVADETLRSLFLTQRAACRTQARRLTRMLGGPGRGLEVGSYVGAFLAAARENRWEFEGLDVNHAAVDFTRREGFRAHRGSLDDLGGLDRTERFDAVAIWNTFEQLAEPRAAAAAALPLLRPGGILAIRVPNGAFYAAIRARAAAGGAVSRALLAHNNLLGFPYRHAFTPESLKAMLERVGFREIGTVGDVLVPIADGYTRRWAAAEERLVKMALRAGMRFLPPPWFEMYATPAER